MVKENKGITLITLAIAVIVLLILASITTYYGIDTIKSSKLTKYKTELEMVQAQVDVLYEKYKDTIDGVDIGKTITASDEEDAKKALKTIGVNSLEGYKIFDKEVLQKLGVEGIDNKFLVNIKEREVLTLKPHKYEGKEYYNLAQIVGERKIKEQLERGELTFNMQSTELTDGWKINLTDIKFSKYVGKGKVQYQDTASGKWTTVENNLTRDNYSFTIKNSGTYIVKVTDSAGKAYEQNLELGVWVDIEIPATVQLVDSGSFDDVAVTNGEFSFKVDNATVGNIKSNKDTFSNDGNGNIKFDIRIYGEGEHKFQLYQLEGTNSSITYDTRIFDITVITEENAEGKLDVKNTYAQEGETINQTGGNYVDEITFCNLIEADEY